MDKQLANSAWLMMAFPAEVRLQDVDNVFFGGITNHYYYEVDAKDEPDLLQVHHVFVARGIAFSPRGSTTCRLGCCAIGARNISRRSLSFAQDECSHHGVGI